MAITHFTPQIIGRADGRSAVLSAAYRHCARMEHEAEARAVDYSAKRNLAHEEFLLPADAPAWARALIVDKSVAGAVEAFWNKVEAYEQRTDAQFAKEFIVALPVELSLAQNIELFRQFVIEQVLARGQVADWVLHDEPGNPHVHLMTTLRPLTETGFGPKKIAVMGANGEAVRTGAGKIQYRLWAGEKTEFLEQRQGWLDLQNQHLALAGLDIRVDGRSYADRGIGITPTTHIGAAAKAIARRCDAADVAADLERIARHETARQVNARRIVERPGIVLEMLAQEKSVFDERDVARLLHRYVDDTIIFKRLLTRVLQSPQCLKLVADHVDLATGLRVPAKLTTWEMVRTEAEMANRAGFLARTNLHGVRKTILAEVLSHHERLSAEQKAAIGHLTGSNRIAAVVGRAGAGKTTMMKAAREAWEACGYRVVGGALAGKAAENIETEAGIASRTLTSWEMAWQQGKMLLDDNTVFVLDEAGMVASRQMAVVVQAVTKAQAKLVLVGDPEQLQPIEAGAAFRAITNRIGYVELGTIYRQREAWMRRASMDLARAEVGKALCAYDRAGLVQTAWSRDEAIASLIAEWDRDFDPAKPSLILAYLRRDVRLLNEMAREKLVARGLVGEGFAFRTRDGERRFDTHDRIVFLRNDASLGIKNGMLGTVVEAAEGRLVAEIGNGNTTRRIQIDQRFYCNLDHGYATTIHKSQGATVDDVRVLVSRNMDRHLTYVALTRHRDTVRLYVGMNEFVRSGGALVAHGCAPFENDPKNSDSYFVTLETAQGRRSTIWGVELDRALKKANAQIGDRIGLGHNGSEKVRLPDGRQAVRHRWEVINLQTLVVEKLVEQLSRDGMKETTLDYMEGTSLRQALRFAENRGLHMMRVARTIIQDRITWMLRQKNRLARIGRNLVAVGARLGLSRAALSADFQANEKPEPMIKGVTSFSTTVADAAEQRLKREPSLAKHWDDLSDRVCLVYADSEAAFRAMRFDAVLAGAVEARQRLLEIEQRPESFGALRGRDGLFASRTDRNEREVAVVNAPALRRDIERYLSLRQTLLNKLTANEQAYRRRVSIDIPALSTSAAAVLEKVRSALDRNDLSAVLRIALADPVTKAEIDAFNRKVGDRFGERAFLSLAAQKSNGSAFDRAAAGLAPGERLKLAAAWPLLRASQQLDAHERAAQSLTQAEALRQSRRQSQTLK